MAEYNPITDKLDAYFIEVDRETGRILRKHSQTYAGRFEGVPDAHQITEAEMRLLETDAAQKWDGSRIVPMTQEEIDAIEAERQSEIEAAEAVKQSVAEDFRAHGFRDETIAVIMARLFGA